VITGASSGIGRQAAADLAAAGARVCVAARREELLRTLVEEIGGEAAGHSYVATDVTDRRQVAGLAAHVRGAYGRCDALVNNAGFSKGREFKGGESIDDVEAVMRTNFFGAVYCTAAFLPLLEASAPSSVVNVASMAGRLAFGNASGYCASKFALVGWSEAVRFDLEPKGVNVALVEPGPIPTEGFSQEGLVDHPVYRYALGTPADVSAAIKDAITRRKAERVVPRWYYLLQIPRVLAPPLYRSGVRRFATPNVPEDWAT